MPTYVFRNKETDEVFEKFMSISAREGYLAEHPELEQMPTHFGFGGVQNTKLKKPDEGFKEVMAKISENMTVGRAAKKNLLNYRDNWKG